MTQAPSNNVVEVSPGPNIYTVLMIISILALVVTICFSGRRLMSETNPKGNGSVPGGYGLSIGEMFTPFDEQKQIVNSRRGGSSTSSRNRARTPRK